MSEPYLVWQLIDSAFPAGGFAHSAGLEAAWQQGHVGGTEALEGFIAAALHAAAHAAVPFVVAAHRAGSGGPPAGGGDFEAIDRQCDALLNNHVANRASRAQGRAFLSVAAKIFGGDELVSLADTARARRLPAHFAPAFGAVCAALGLSARESADVFMFLNLRGMISAAVRLGIVGPLEGQRLQRSQSPHAARCAEAGSRMAVESAAQTAPLLDLLQAGHDRLYSRLFQS